MARMVAGPLARWAFLISSTEAIDPSYVLKLKPKIKLRKERELSVHKCLELAWESSVWVLAFYNLCFTNSHPLVVFELSVGVKVCVREFFSWWGWFSDMYACVNVFVLFSVLHLPIGRRKHSIRSHLLYIEIRTFPASWKLMHCSFDFSMCGKLLPTFLLKNSSKSFKFGFLNLK